MLRSCLSFYQSAIRSLRNPPLRYNTRSSSEVFA
jgi:hypothetical protein